MDPGVFAEVLSAAAAAPPPFVGREREGAALAAALAQACAGRGTVVFVTGEAGIGKTRLAEEFAAGVPVARARVLWGRSWEGAAPPFWPWTEALRELIDDERADVLRARELVRLLPELGASLQLDGERARFLLFDAVAALLAAATARTPTVLVLDDFHVADSASVLLLQFVAERLAASRLLVVVLLREIAAAWATSRGGASDSRSPVSASGRSTPSSAASRPCRDAGGRARGPRGNGRQSAVRGRGRASAPRGGGSTNGETSGGCPCPTESGRRSAVVARRSGPRREASSGSPRCSAASSSCPSSHP
jgi:hypothetical protein